MGQMIHCTVSLGYLEALIREKGNRGFLEREGRSLSDAEALDAIREQRTKGYEVWPAGCDNMLPDGRCGGHPA